MTEDPINSGKDTLLTEANGMLPLLAALRLPLEEQIREYLQSQHDRSAHHRDTDIDTILNVYA
jgi:hypothetical protein